MQEIMIHERNAKTAAQEIVTAAVLSNIRRGEIREEDQRANNGKEI